MAWWNFCVVGNYVARYYHFAVTTVRELQKQIQSKLDEDVFALEKTIETILEMKSESSRDIPSSLSLSLLFPNSALLS